MALPKLIAGNWKMNGLADDAAERMAGLVKKASENGLSGFEMVVCPPATLLVSALEQAGNSGIQVGGQDCHAENSGAFTGNIAAPMLADLGCQYVIVGHSERRQYHNEGDADVAAKAKAAHDAGLTAIICIGETDAEREAGKANEVVSGQFVASLPDTASVENTVIAYEPVWAIGTGKVASAEDVKDMHAVLRAKAEELVSNGASLRLLYGGSVKPGNAPEILHTPNVDGVLVGGASLKPDDFWAIATASNADNTQIAANG